MRGATLRQLRSFSIVARHLSFAKAAAEMHLTPSAVSLQIKELEQAAGLALLSRHAKRVSLTPAGQVLLPDVRRALQALQHAEDSMARLRDRETGLVTVGMVSSAKYFLPRMLAQFRELHRDVELRISVANRDALLGLLRRGEVDVAVMGAPPEDFEGYARPFAALPLGVLAAPEHELTQAQSIPVAALAGYEFLGREPGSGTRAASERFFRQARVDPPRVREMTSNDAIKQAVMANLGLAFLSLHAAALELHGGLLVALDVEGLPMVRRWFIVTMNTLALTDSTRGLCNFVVDHGVTSIAQQFDGIAALRAYAAPAGGS